MNSFHIPLWLRITVVGFLACGPWVSSLLADQLGPMIHPGLRSPEGNFWYQFGDYRRSGLAYKTDLRQMFQLGASTGQPALDAFLKGDLVGAKAILHREHEGKPWTTPAHLLAGRIELEGGNPDRALEQFAFALKDEPRNHQALLLSAVAHTRLGNYRQAIDDFKYGLRADAEGSSVVAVETMLETVGELIDRPRQERPLALLAHFYRYLRILDDSNGRLAIRTATQAIQQGDFVDEAHLTIGIVHYRGNQFDDALESFEHAIAVNPKNAEAYHWASLGYSAHGDLAKEYLMRKRATEAEPDDAFYARNFSVLMTDKLGDLYQALDIAHKALDRAPEEARLLAQVGRVYLELGEWEQTRNYYQRAIERDPRNVEYQDYLGYALESMGRFEEAIEVYQGAIRLQPNYADAHVSLGAALSRKHRYQEALKEYDTAASFGARGLLFQQGLCSLLWRTGEFRRAKQCYQQLLREDPGNVFANRNLPYVLANLPNPSSER